MYTLDKEMADSDMLCYHICNSEVDTQEEEYDVEI